MRSTTRISALQLYIMLFLSRVVISLTVNAQTVGNDNFLDNILSSAILFSVLSIATLPILSLSKKHGSTRYFELVRSDLGAAWYIFAALYTVYFVIMNIYSTALFLILITNTLSPEAARWSIVLIISVIAVYGAIKGIETISRTSICVLILLLLGFIILYTALIPMAEPEYLKPMLSDGAQQMLNGTLVFISRCTSLAEMAVLLPFVRGKRTLGFFIWNGGTALFAVLLLTMLSLCLGEYAFTQLLPAYTLATAAEIVGIQRLGVLMMGLCIMALTIKLSSGYFIISECWSLKTGNDKRRVVIIAAAIICSAAALWITADTKRSGMIFEYLWLLPMTVITGYLLPTILWFADKFTRRGTK